MVKETKDKCEREKIIVAQMIALYCKKQHRSKQLCADCASLAEYARINVHLWRLSSFVQTVKYIATSRK